MGEAEVVIFDVTDDLGHVFKSSSHFLLPRIGIGGDMGNVTLVVAGCKDWPGGVEIHITSGPKGVIRPQDGLDHGRTVGRGNDGLINAIGSVVRKLD